VNDALVILFQVAVRALRAVGVGRKTVFASNAAASLSNPPGQFSWHEDELELRAMIVLE
jgi:hypothetical protein